MAVDKGAGMPSDLIDSPEFALWLQQKLGALPASQFDLQQALQRGSFALPETLRVSILSIERQGVTARIRINLFFKSVIAGCNCADDPTPADTLDEYGSATLLLDQNQDLLEVHID
jgi:hypothetical protein